MSDLISRCELFNRLATVKDIGEAFAVIQGMPTKADKEHMELLNLRKRVEAQREEIKRLTEEKETVINTLQWLLANGLIKEDGKKVVPQ